MPAAHPPTLLDLLTTAAPASLPPVHVSEGNTASSTISGNGVLPVSVLPLSTVVCRLPALELLMGEALLTLLQQPPLSTKLSADPSARLLRMHAGIDYDFARGINFPNKATFAQTVRVLLDAVMYNTIEVDATAPDACISCEEPVEVVGGRARKLDRALMRSPHGLMVGTVELTNKWAGEKVLNSFDQALADGPISLREMKSHFTFAYHALANVGPSPYSAHVEKC
jgi:hypothetical protein